MMSLRARGLAPVGSIACAVLAFTPAVASMRGEDCSHDHPTPTAELRGSVSTLEGRALAGALVTARTADSRVSTTVVSDAGGHFRFPSLVAGTHQLELRRPGFVAQLLETRLYAGAQRTLDISLRPGDDNVAVTTSAQLLAALPEGDDKRKFILDCTGCHQFDQRIALPEGRVRTHADWSEAVSRMLRYAGATTRFPVISADRDADKTAEWLTRHLRTPAALRTAPIEPSPRAVITEYAHPVAADLPHDLMLDASGKVVITGMFSHRMFVLDPASGVFTEVGIPESGAGPRALDIDPDGIWWVLLGGVNKIGRYDPQSSRWTTYATGMYPHSIMRDARGRIWFNGHFTRDPELIGSLDGATGAVETYEVPSTPEIAAGAGPIPYGLRVAPNGTVWGSELKGNRIFGYDPDTKRFSVHQMPTPHSGPRRFDIDADGRLWIPEYAGNALTRFDPATGRFRQYPLPIRDALPYVVRVDRRGGTVWIGTGAADAMLSFDPRAEQFEVYPLPTRGALVRHLSIDPRTGAVWGAYGASPGIPPKIVRLELKR
ncbi:MAG TPA: carboxypeptidase regulatory-like domain-containing protein [Gemmatimonadaceae bacterium]|nr:carboxypeptidase regulatory-like domain-containing protein [Gemmatimonadaceae bacterium]